MGGRPVWLASVSKRSTISVHDRIIPTSRWKDDLWQAARQILWTAVRDRGDQSRYRLFRMQVTVCLHVALSDAELTVVPCDWHERPGTALAGGPVEVLEEQGIPDIPSTKPCESPYREPIADYDPELWIPLDCGRCAPCEARIAIVNRMPL